MPGPGGRRKAYFNPRSPCGERRRASRGAWRSPDFNPRSPCGERLTAKPTMPFFHIFQSALPLRGATDAIISYTALPTPISIRAPLAGSDCTSAPADNKRAGFQSALPLRGATMYLTVMGNTFSISIRAPLAGSDLPLPTNDFLSFYFNPRSPCGERLLEP